MTDNQETKMAKASNADAELRAYEIYVAEMAALADGRVIRNSSLDHAEIIIAQIFKTSKSSVDILTGELDARVYGSPRVSGAAVEFLGRGGTSIRILSEGKVEDANPFLMATRAAASECVCIKQLPSAISTPSHFALGDGTHLRIEEDKRTCNAIVMFGAEKQAHGLSHVFDAIFKNAI